MSRHGRRLRVRSALYVVFGWMHCALLFAPYYALLLKNFILQTASWDEMAFYQLQGLLFIVPVALSWVAERYLKHILLYLPACAAIFGITWALFGSFIPGIPALYVCFLRMYGRINGEKHSLLDHAGWPGIPVVLLPAVISVFVDQVNESFQYVGLLFAAVYFLVLCGQSGIRRIDAYLDTNRALANFPERRIVRLLSAVLALMVLVAGLIAVPPLVVNRAPLHIDLPTRETTAAPSEPEPESRPAPDTDMSQALEALGGGAEPNPFFEAFFRILEYLLIAGVTVGAVVGVVIGALHISRSFRTSYRDRGDYVENLQDDEVEALRIRRAKRDRPGLLDRSPNAVLRRRWRRAILRAKKEPPLPSMSPAEAEAHAGLTGEPAALLHRLYEKARYSELGADREDLKA